MSRPDIWPQYDALFDAMNICSFAWWEAETEGRQKLNRIRDYLSEQAAELLPWGRAVNEKSMPQFNFRNGRVIADHVSRF